MERLRTNSHSYAPQWLANFCSGVIPERTDTDERDDGRREQAFESAGEVGFGAWDRPSQSLGNRRQGAGLPTDPQLLDRRIVFYAKDDGVINH